MFKPIRQSQTHGVFSVRARNGVFIVNYSYAHTRYRLPSSRTYPETLGRSAWGGWFHSTHQRICIITPRLSQIYQPPAPSTNIDHGSAIQSNMKPNRLLTTTKQCSSKAATRVGRKGGRPRRIRIHRE